MNVKYCISILFILMLSNKVNAQKKLQPCTSENYLQFDFWLGDWEVYDDSNILIGTNNIIKMPNACAIQENWTSKTSNNKGTSYTYYNYSDKKWHQIWIDNTGFVLSLQGNFIDGKMILKSDLIKNKQQNYYNQITWYTKNNMVLQVWDYLDENNIPIKQVFKGVYKKKINKN